MIKKVIYSILTLGFLASCGFADSNKKTQILKSYFENGQLKKLFGLTSDGEKQNIGLQKYWYKNGQVEREFSYNENTRFDGLNKQWYENGQLSYEGNYKDGKTDGLHKSWFENGQLFLAVNYKHGTEDGLYKQWYENGQLKYEGKYKGGRFVEYTKDGMKMVNCLLNLNGIQMGN